jgi:hypothetical protein
LVEWVQGQRTPRQDRVDDEFLIDAKILDGLGLPEDFELHTSCEGCDAWVEAGGWCEGGVWRQVVVARPLEPPGIPEEWALLARNERGQVLAELRRELGPGHLLRGRALFPLAWRRSTDDVLIRAVEAPEPLWVVHLTWRAETSESWPHAQGFPDLVAFRLAHRE